MKKARTTKKDSVKKVTLKDLKPAKGGVKGGLSQLWNEKEKGLQELL